MNNSQSREDARRLVKIISQAARKPDPETGADCWGVVASISEGSTRVTLDGGQEVDAIPLVSAREGELVLVRMAGHAAYIVGNSSAPPTDDAAANEAGRQAAQALVDAAQAARTASDFMTYLNGVLTLGSPSSGIRNVITPTRQGFETDAGEILWMGVEDGIGKMHADNAEIGDMLRFGGFAWIARDNGNMTLKWIGD